MKYALLTLQLLLCFVFGFSQSDSERLDQFVEFSKKFNRTNPSKSIVYADSGISLAIQLEDVVSHAKCLMNKGVATKYLGEIDKGIELYYESIKVLNGKDEKLEAGAHINIGSALWQMNKMDACKKHFKLALERFERLEDAYGMANVYINLGILAAIDSNYTESMTFFKKSEYNFDVIDNQAGLARVYDNIGNLLQIQGQTDQAIKYINKSFNIHKSMKDNYGVINTLIAQHSIYLNNGDDRSALGSLIHAEEIAKETEYTSQKAAIAQAKSQIYASKGDFKNAFTEYKKYKSWNDSLISVESESKIADLESTYENEKHKKEIEVLNMTSELNEAKLAEQNAAIEKDFIIKISLYIGIALVLIASLILIRSVLNKKKANQIIRQQKEEVEKKHKEITDSINYAERIQHALINNQTSWEKVGKERFITFLPKDVVSGDFYWSHHDEQSNFSIWIAADCTGHGVPGAMMSMLGGAMLNEIVNENSVFEPAEILDLLRVKIIDLLHDSSSEKERRDGMDVALCYLNHNTNELKFAGANNPLWIVTSKDELNVKSKCTQIDSSDLFLHEIKATKQPVGNYVDNSKPFEQISIQLSSNDQLFTFSDGFPDQFGGEKGKKYKYARFKKFLLKNANLSMKEQGQLVHQEFKFWKGDIEQLDDVLVVGVKV